MDFENHFDRSLRVLGWLGFTTKYPQSWRGVLTKFAAYFQICCSTFGVVCQLTFMFNHRDDIFLAANAVPFVVSELNVIFRLTTFYYHREKIHRVKVFLTKFLSGR